MRAGRAACSRAPLLSYIGTIRIREFESAAAAVAANAHCERYSLSACRARARNHRVNRRGRADVVARLQIAFGAGRRSQTIERDNLAPGEPVDRPQAYGINCASIDSADDEVSETYSCRRCRSTGSRSAKFRNGYATADSLWQQGGSSEAWRTLRVGGMVCPAWSRSCCIQRAGWL